MKIETAENNQLAGRILNETTIEIRLPALKGSSRYDAMLEAGWVTTDEYLETKTGDIIEMAPLEYSITKY